MTERSLTRYSVLRKLIDGLLTAGEAAGQLSLTVRQVRRLKKEVKKRGARALVHGNTGRKSNRRLEQARVDQVTTLIKTHYRDFGPTLAAEKLKERHGISLSTETVRTLMRTAGLWKPRTRAGPRVHRIWRPRKEREGELVQFDGSYHHWLEDRGGTGELCLLAAIDDATGTILRLEFEEHEGVRPVFRFWKGYVEEHGVPTAVYLDSFSTYKVNHQAARDNRGLITQFERAAGVLGMKLVVARSPQAKGRVERLFDTLQDRLVKEMRLRGISDCASANRYLRNKFVPWFNERFAVVPARTGNLHRELVRHEKEALPATFSVEETRVVANDFTIRYKNAWLQLTAEQTVTVRPNDTVVIEERLDGRRMVRHERRGRYLSYLTLPRRPERASRKRMFIPATRKRYVPPPDHPWRTSSDWLFAKNRRAGT